MSLRRFSLVSFPMNVLVTRNKARTERPKMYLPTSQQNMEKANSKLRHSCRKVVVHLVHIESKKSWKPTLIQQDFMAKTKTRHVLSMIHSARPTVLLVVNIVFAWNLLCFEKWGRTYVRTYGRHVQKQWSLPPVTVGWPRGSILQDLA